MRNNQRRKRQDDACYGLVTPGAEKFRRMPIYLLSRLAAPAASPDAPTLLSDAPTLTQPTAVVVEPETEERSGPTVPPPTRGEVATVSAVGDSFPLTCTANGKAYLAELDDAAIEALVGKARALAPGTFWRGGGGE